MSQPGFSFPQPLSKTVPAQWWNVYNYIARQWYENEYGQIEQDERWYHPAMLAMERMIAQKPVHHV